MPSARTLELLASVEIPVFPDYPDLGLLHYDREGEPITLGQWCGLRALPDYYRIAYTELDLYHVSTVWLGIDHGFGLRLDAPIIFETMAFGNETNWSPDMEIEGFSLRSRPYHPERDQRRYSTEAQALAGHEEVVTQIRAIEETMKATDPRDVGA